MQEDLISPSRDAGSRRRPPRCSRFWTDPEKILRWMGTEAQLEPQPGGLYLVNVTGARFARGSFREVVPVHRLAYSFGWDGSEVVPPGSSLVEIDLMDQPPDGTLLRLTHTGLPNADQCAGHAEGRAHYLGRLAGGWPPGATLSGSQARPHRAGLIAPLHKRFALVADAVSTPLENALLSRQWTCLRPWPGWWTRAPLRPAPNNSWPDLANDCSPMACRSPEARDVLRAASDYRPAHLAVAGGKAGP